jgi:hypothetical protein
MLFMRLEDYRERLIGTDTIPLKLFKFHSINTYTADGKKALNSYLFDAIKNHYLWHADPASLNDPFDCYKNLVEYGQPSAEVLFQLLRKAGYNDINKAIDEVHRLWNEPKELVAAFRSTTPIWYICSFTTNQTSNTMWSHYADCHKGLCLTFDNTKLSENNILACKVSYKTEFNAINYFEQQETALLNMITTKSQEWEYEREFRSFHDNIGEYHYSKACLIGITFGCKTTPDDITKVQAKVIKAGFSNIEWSQAKMQSDSFDLSIEPLK